MPGPLLIQGAGSAKVLPHTDGVLIGVVLDRVHLVLLVVEYVCNIFCLRIFLSALETVFLFHSGTEARPLCSFVSLRY